MRSVDVFVLIATFIEITFHPSLLRAEKAGISPSLTGLCAHARHGRSWRVPNSAIKCRETFVAVGLVSVNIADVTDIRLIYSETSCVCLPLKKRLRLTCLWLVRASSLSRRNTSSVVGPDKSPLIGSVSICEDLNELTHCWLAANVVVVCCHAILWTGWYEIITRIEVKTFVIGKCRSPLLLFPYYCWNLNSIFFHRFVNK